MKKLIVLFVFGAVLCADQEASAWGGYAEAAGRAAMERKAKGIPEPSMKAEEAGFLASMFTFPAVGMVVAGKVIEGTGSFAAGVAAGATTAFVGTVVTVKTCKDVRKNGWWCCRSRKAKPAARDLREAVRED